MGVGSGFSYGFGILVSTSVGLVSGPSSRTFAFTYSDVSRIWSAPRVLCPSFTVKDMDLPMPRRDSDVLTSLFFNGRFLWGYGSSEGIFGPSWVFTSWVGSPALWSTFVLSPVLWAVGCRGFALAVRSLSFSFSAASGC